jgi:hypothetical protein
VDWHSLTFEASPDKLRNRTLTGRMLLLELVLVFLAAGCGIFPENVSVSDQRVQSLLKAAADFDRASYGFSPLPTSGRVSLEPKPSSGYDAMLHLGGKTSRTIAFRKNTSGYFWIGEQEMFVVHHRREISIRWRVCNRPPPQNCRTPRAAQAGEEGINSEPSKLLTNKKAAPKSALNCLRQFASR